MMPDIGRVSEKKGSPSDRWNRYCSVVGWENLGSSRIAARSQVRPRNDRRNRVGFNSEELGFWECFGGGQQKSS
jgi:hypothetical protein